MIFRSGAVIAAALACAVLLAGCSADTRDDAAPRDGSASAPTAPPSFSPVASGSTDVGSGKSADRLIALVTTLPARTRAVESAPDPALDKPQSTIGCGAAQRSVFWVAEGWTVDSLALWVKSHPFKGFSASLANNTTVPDAGRVVVQGVNHSYPAGFVEHIVYVMVPISGGDVGVRVEAEAGPILPCATTQDGTGNK